MFYLYNIKNKTKQLLALDITVKSKIMKELSLEIFANQYKAEDLFGAMMATNGDPVLIEDEDVAEAIYNEITENGTEVEIITAEDGEDYDRARAILDLKGENVRKIYIFAKYNECATYIAFSNDF